MAIVVSHIADDFETLAARALRQAPLADLIEIRLDRIGHPGKEALASFCAAAKKPVIVTCHGVATGGDFQGSVDEELDLLSDAAEAGARFVDVDWRLSLELGEVQAPCHRIVSRHADDTPEDLDTFAEEVRDVLYEGDVTKVVTTANSCEDGLRFLKWLRTTRGLVGFCMGEKGRFTRVLAPIFGSPFTYCAPANMPGEEGGEPTAAGQFPVNEFHALAPPGGLNQETAIFGVVGRPIGHSLSPWVHGMALKGARLDAVYVALEPESMENLLELADDENYRGFSVTAPFKEEAFRLVSGGDESVSRTGAVNTLIRERRGWSAANTDVPAVRDTLARGLAVMGRGDGSAKVLSEVHTLVLGAGGAARAVVWAAKAMEGRVTVAARDRSKADALARDLGCEAVGWEEVGQVDYDVLVNATPVGSIAAPPEAPKTPLDPEALRSGTLVMDAVYRPMRTQLLADAHQRGCTPVPGGEWFVRQASAQFRLFTGADADDGLLRASFEHALQEAD